MAQELRAVTVNLKSFDQNIPDPIIAGGADADGRTFRILFEQEAAAQLTSQSKLYLSWRHQQDDVRGYNVFDKVDDDELQTWEIKWPQKMLREGDVLCCVELVDGVSIVQSQNFTVHVLANPNDGSEFVLSNDFTVFQQAVINMNSMVEKVEERFETLQSEIDALKVDIETFKTQAEKMSTKLDGLTNSIEDLTTLVTNKLDQSRVGFEFDKEVKTIKDYIDNRSIEADAVR